ncbi:Transglutaminase-like superfamily protein [Verrucomicrobiia bacterium DG1235]|nr:Transglutaminase-like superfamily protein [Verrucomicrobiae bacterium DG1235]
MRTNRKPILVAPTISLSFWFALSAALVAFSIVSENLPFAFSIAIGAIALRCISTQAPKLLKHAARFTFTFSCYLAALLPLWPDPLTSYYSAPLALACGVALLAALNQNSYGGSRGFTSIAAIAFLLFIRNVVLYHDFQAPIQELSLALAFIAFLEIALSNRYQKNHDRPHPELVFGLMLALVASFHIESLPLATFLAALPLAAFLLRNHKLATSANEHSKTARPRFTDSGDDLAPRRPLNKAHGFIIAVPLLFASLLYLLTLRLPFWADLVPQNAPYIAQSIAEKANIISDAADLENESIEEFADTIIDEKFIKEKATQIAQSWNTPPTEEETKVSDASQSAAPAETLPTIRRSELEAVDVSDYGLGPFAKNKASNYPTESLTATSPSQNAAISIGPPNSLLPAGPRAAPITPPQASLGTGIPDDLLSNRFSPDSEFEPSPSNSSQSASASSSQATNQETIEQSVDFNRFLDSFDEPEQAISQALNLEGSDVTALLSQEPLVTVKLESSRNAPRRLYLRSNVLDTLSRFGLRSIHSNHGLVEVSTENDSIVSLDNFLQSKSEGETITITSNQSRYPTLPLPESFARLQVFDTDSISIYPEERVALAPIEGEPVTYRIYNADLDISDRERSTSNPSDVYLERMLEVPLSQSDRDYLTTLANRVGGGRSPTRRFAYRFANYFANRHPYSYFVTIPRGSGHAVVRWLKNESPGLCSNYAAAFTLLARSRGIPARVVGGYATNEFDSSEKRYVLRQSNAHAWVEYLDESNQWIRFDPTPGITEAEIRRAEQYVTTARQESLPRLLKAERQALARIKSEKTAPPTLRDTPSLAAKPPAERAAASPQPLISPQAPSANEPTETSQTPPIKPTSTREKVVPTPEPANDYSHVSKFTEDSSDSPSTPLTQETSNPPAAEPASNPPWLLLLALLALAIPAIAYFVRTRTPITQSPQTHLRHKAGRLLNQLETLIQQHHLETDPVWNETRQTLSSQRYGRETDSILIRDLAVKVALLAKRKN